jgi:hypothetical protein
VRWRETVAGAVRAEVEVDPLARECASLEMEYHRAAAGMPGGLG